MKNLKIIAEGGLIVLIVVSLAILIERLTNTSEIDDDLERINSRTVKIDVTTSPTVDIVETVFDSKFSKCLTEHSKSYYYPLKEVTNTSSFCVPHDRCIHNFLIDISRLLKLYDIKLQLVEPDLLFCLLPSTGKYNLLTRGFSSSKFRGSRNVVTFGISSLDAKILDEAGTRKKLISSGYRITRFQRTVSNQSYQNEVDSIAEFLHYFIRQDDILIHLIVLYPRETLLWSPGFNTLEINVKGLQYVNDTAFENFTVSALFLDDLSTASLYLPSDARCFLLDMMSSNFLECKAVSLVGIPSMNTHLNMALKELKAVFASHMVSFWLWSKTLQGWFEKCNILQYSEELKFSVAAKSVEGFNFTAMFDNSKCELTENNLNLNSSIKNVKLNCHEVSIDLIFMYEERATFWYEYADEQNTYRLKFPKFTLCSTDVNGEKMAIPCETSEILEGEYGQFLKNTTLSLNPEKMRNVQLLDKASL